MRILLFNFLFFLAINGSAVNIHGFAPQFEGAFIRLYEVSDFISYHEEKVDVVKIGEGGEFSMSFISNQSRLVKLKILDMSVSMITTPDMNLEIKLDYNEELNLGKIFDKTLTLEILDKGDFDINANIWAYQRDYAEFLEINQSKLVTKKMLPEVAKFQPEMQQKYGKNAHPYFQTYLKYDLAALEDAVLGSETTLYETYLKDQQVIYDNLGYMNFFVQFYQERFIQISQGKEGLYLLSAVNGTQDLEKLKEIVGQHKYAGNDVSIELFIILGLKEVYGDETFKKQKVLNMLKMIAETAINRENQKIAENIVYELTFLSPGKKAPDYSLKDSGEKVHHLYDLQKNVLLVFWSANSPTCLRELQFLEEYLEKYGEKLDIVGINIDDNPEKAKNYLLKNKASWLGLYKDQQFDVMDKYRVYSVPMYVLLNPTSEVIHYPAKRPEENLELDLFNLPQ